MKKISLREQIEDILKKLPFGMPDKKFIDKLEALIKKREVELQLETARKIGQAACMGAYLSPKDLADPKAWKEAIKKHDERLLDRVEKEVIGKDIRYRDIEWSKQNPKENLAVTLINIEKDRQRKTLKEIKKE